MWRIIFLSHCRLLNAPRGLRGRRRDRDVRGKQLPPRLFIYLFRHRRRLCRAANCFLNVPTLAFHFDSSAWSIQGVEMDRVENTGAAERLLPKCFHSVQTASDSGAPLQNPNTTRSKPVRIFLRRSWFRPFGSDEPRRYSLPTIES